MLGRRSGRGDSWFGTMPHLFWLDRTEPIATKKTYPSTTRPERDHKKVSYLKDRTSTNVWKEENQYVLYTGWPRQSPRVKQRRKVVSCKCHQNSANIGIEQLRSHDAERDELQCVDKVSNEQSDIVNRAEIRVRFELQFVDDAQQNDDDDIDDQCSATKGETFRCFAYV